VPAALVEDLLAFGRNLVLMLLKTCHNAAVAPLDIGAVGLNIRVTGASPRLDGVLARVRDLVTVLLETLGDSVSTTCNIGAIGFDIGFAGTLDRGLVSGVYGDGCTG
jgi:hypothetical protein